MPPPPPAQQDQETHLASVAKPKTYQVLVTGFGPFSEDHPTNPSHLIATSLPPSIPLSSTANTPTSPPASTIEILPLAVPIRVSYAAVDALIPALYAAHPEPDVVLHIGMASGRECFALEERARRDGYERMDVDGADLEGGSWSGEREVKEVLRPGVDMADVLSRWRDGVRNQDIDVRSSSDAGLFLCEYIYFSSLAHVRLSLPPTSSPALKPHSVKKLSSPEAENTTEDVSATKPPSKETETTTEGEVERRPPSEAVLPVHAPQPLFLHVPATSAPADLERGRSATIELLRAVVGSLELARRGGDVGVRRG